METVASAGDGGDEGTRVSPSLRRAGFADEESGFFFVE